MEEEEEAAGRTVKLHNRQLSKEIDAGWECGRYPGRLERQTGTHPSHASHHIRPSQGPNGMRASRPSIATPRDIAITIRSATIAQTSLDHAEEQAPGPLVHRPMATQALALPRNDSRAEVHAYLMEK
jgi:hypothetical protein